MTGGAHVDLAAGAWAVVLVLVIAGILGTALHPVLRHLPETPVCAEPDTAGAHPLGPPDPTGAQQCSCGTVRRIPRTDTRELAAVTALPLEELDTDVRPALRLVRAQG